MVVIWPSGDQMALEGLKMSKVWIALIPSTYGCAHQAWSRTSKMKKGCSLLDQLTKDWSRVRSAVLEACQKLNATFEDAGNKLNCTSSPPCLSGDGAQQLWGWQASFSPSPYVMLVVKEQANLCRLLSSRATNLSLSI